MTKTELESLLARIESIHARTARGILRLREVLEHYDDFTQSARERISEQAREHIDAVQAEFAELEGDERLS